MSPSKSPSDNICKYVHVFLAAESQKVCGDLLNFWNKSLFCARQDKEERESALWDAFESASMARGPHEDEKATSEEALKVRCLCMQNKSIYYLLGFLQ